jgi:hypothetical protein
MPQKRRKGQCLDFAIGGLKRLAYDKAASATVRLEVLKLMLMLDDVYPKGAEILPQPVAPSVSEDSLLANLRAKHAGAGGTNEVQQNLRS